MNKTKEEQPICEWIDDGSLFEDFEWEVNRIFANLFPKMKVGMIAENHGWRKRNGYNEVDTYDKGYQAVVKCISGDTQCRIYVRTNNRYGRHLAINTVHHDSPMWGVEWSYIIRESRFNKEALTNN